jgi:hypothetical protein
MSDELGGVRPAVFASNVIPLMISLELTTVPTKKLENWRFVTVQPLVKLAGGVENGRPLSGLG